VASSALVRDGRFGLVAMQERVEMAGGRFQVNTRPGAGVTLRAMFRRSPGGLGRAAGRPEPERSTTLR
jgi:signal transduction histidine kinase